MKLDDADVTWDILATHLEAFLQCWESGPEPPSLAAHLPPGTSPLRRMVLAELVKIDLEYRQQKEVVVYRLEDYLAEYPELAEPDGVPADLIYEEYHVRKSAGQAVDANEYLARFPSQAVALARLFQLNSPTHSTSLKNRQLHASLQPGDRIDDFHLLSELGKGAFGCVFLARQESMQRLVALKISCDRGQEGQTLAQLDHPHIVRVYDQSRLPERNLRLLYMQYVPGGTLESLVRLVNLVDRNRRDGRLVVESISNALDKTGVLSPHDLSVKREIADRSWPEVVCRWGVELATALHFAHAHGILHRDVKPANVLLEASGSAKLTDFNISFSSQLDGASPVAYFGGSLAYMSVEQLEACHPSHERQPNDLDGRSDIYSLGVLLWELLNGQRPHGDEAMVGSWAETLRAMIELRRRGMDDQVESTNDNVAEQLTSILRRCLAPHPDDRYADADELARELSLCLQPRVARLLRASRRGWPRQVVRWPLVAIVLAALIPNVLAGVFNYTYNKQAIIQHLEGSQTTFWSVQLVINAVAFPPGLFACILFSWPVIRALRSTDREIQKRSNTAARRRSLCIGRFIALLGIVEWLIAGLAYPISLHLILGGLDAAKYAHFFGSLLVCGMIAAAYPFFLLSTLAIRAFFPALLRGDSLGDDDAHELRRLARHMGWFLYLAGGVPAVGVMLLAATGLLIDQQNSFALLVLSATGAVGFAFVLGLFRSLQADIAALQEAASAVL